MISKFSKITATIALFSLATSISTLSLASKARLYSLSQNIEGSFVVDDNRNILLNPAELYGSPEYVTFEWGSVEDFDGNTSTSPNAEGGMVTSLGNGSKLGLFFGYEPNSEANARRIANEDLLIPDNTLTLLYATRLAPGIDGGIQIVYSDNEYEDVVKQSEKYLALRTGVKINNKVSAYIRLVLNSESKGTVEDDDADDAAMAAAEMDKFISNSDIETGIAYDFSEKMRAYAKFAVSELTYEQGSNLEEDSDIEGGYGLKTLGFSHYLKKSIDKLSPSVFYDVNFSSQVIEVEQSEFISEVMSFTLGAEKGVNDWLTLRSSVRQVALFDNSRIEPKDGEKSNRYSRNSSAVSAGLGAEFDGFVLDGSFTTTSGRLNKA